MDWAEFQAKKRAGRGRPSAWAPLIMRLEPGVPTQVPAELIGKRKPVAVAYDVRGAAKKIGVTVETLIDGETVWMARPPADPPPPKPGPDAAVRYCPEPGCRGQVVANKCDTCGKTPSNVRR